MKINSWIRMSFYTVYSSSGSITVSCLNVSTSACESWTTSFPLMVGLGNIKTNGSSAVNSPPKAPRKSLTFTAYDTIIPNASRWSGEASLCEMREFNIQVRKSLIWFKIRKAWSRVLLLKSRRMNSFVLNKYKHQNYIKKVLTLHITRFNTRPHT